MEFDLSEDLAVVFLYRESKKSVFIEEWRERTKTNMKTIHSDQETDSCHAVFLREAAERSTVSEHVLPPLQNKFTKFPPPPKLLPWVLKCLLELLCSLREHSLFSVFLPAPPVACDPTLLGGRRKGSGGRGRGRSPVKGSYFH